MNKNIGMTRKTSESEIRVALDFNGLATDYRKKLKTPFEFLSHMLEHIAWRSGVGLEVDITLPDFFLNHLIFEDLGITLGKAAREFVLSNKEAGVTGFGDAVAIIDEARAVCALSFEERALFVFSHDAIELPADVEGIRSEDLETFLEGFCQGALCTMHLDMVCGVNAHHIWEAAFRALGTALGRTFFIDEARRGMTAGVAGSVEFIKE